MYLQCLHRKTNYLKEGFKIFDRVLSPPLSQKLLVITVLDDPHEAHQPVPSLLFAHTLKNAHPFEHLQYRLVSIPNSCL